ncbi:hypothetical protein GTA08_BOTSDO04737 [Botryosphaeria dothidea]|uniref:Myb-like domain-containing protein n=1 Tax=Botryosphaeria dothidea TaxID=55169 RepID=A0A8H4IVB8_9PEZI|nr:hypothetical protein GTA08_BOTSDO04737 [Botryosphaeria dothidea]
MAKMKFVWNSEADARLLLSMIDILNPRFNRGQWNNIAKAVGYGLSGEAIRQHVKLLKKKHFGTKAAGTPDPPVKSDEQENAENILGKNPNPVRILPSRKRTVQEYVESEDTEEDEYIVSESPTKKVKSEDVGPD